MPAASVPPARAVHVKARLAFPSETGQTVNPGEVVVMREDVALKLVWDGRAAFTPPEARGHLVRAVATVLRSLWPKAGPGLMRRADELGGSLFDALLTGDEPAR